MRSTLPVFLTAITLTLAACGRESAGPQQTATAPSGTAATVTSTGPPQDLRSARVDAVIAPEEGVYLDRARLGSGIGAEGMVDRETTTFARDEPVHLSMWFRESPAGLQARVQLEDAAGKVVHEEQKPMNGQKAVTFSVGRGKLKPGKYKITGFWGGNIAAEYEMTVEDRRAARPGKSKAKTTKR